MKKDYIADCVLMIRPKNFGYNKETAGDNSFQILDENLSVDKIQKQAIKEFNQAVKELRRHDIEVLVIEDTDRPKKTDSIFPNNWLSTHDGKTLITYPMKSANRRKEKREDILKILEKEYGFDKRYSFDYHEEDEQFLEGTGSMVLDRNHKIAYVALSERSNIKVAEKFAVIMGYQKMVFHTNYLEQAVYHTNVLMSIADKFAILCDEIIEDDLERKNLNQLLKNTDKELIHISPAQMAHFCANVIELQDKIGQKYLLMSDNAYQAFEVSQLDIILQYNKIIKVNIPTIEMAGGGGIRCMVAEIFK